MSRERPSHITACVCDSDCVDMMADGATVRYQCANCNRLLGDVVEGAEP
jgi:hypothetical protein